VAQQETASALAEVGKQLAPVGLVALGAALQWVGSLILQRGTIRAAEINAQKDRELAVINTDAQRKLARDRDLREYRRQRLAPLLAWAREQAAIFSSIYDAAIRDARKRRNDPNVSFDSGVPRLWMHARNINPLNDLLFAAQVDPELDRAAVTFKDVHNACNNAVQGYAAGFKDTEGPNLNELRGLRYGTPPDGALIPRLQAAAASLHAAAEHYIHELD
jgi:hypothetical protein